MIKRNVVNPSSKPFKDGQKLGKEQPDIDINKYCEDNNIDDTQNFKFGFYSIVNQKYIIQNSKLLRCINEANKY